ncbi:MAG: hypothetical protein V4724_04335 [Pseudomonadota bacterium]
MLRTIAGAALLICLIDAPARAAPAEARVPAPLVLSDAIIRQAVKETLAESRAQQAQSAPQGPALSAGKTDALTAAFADAKVPDCLHAEGLKRQPTSIGPIGVGGFLALPFVAVAKLRGKCQ